MVFYEIQILSVPEIKFAYDVALEKYRNKFRRIENFLEIALCLEGRILFEYESGEKEISGGRGTLIPMTRDIACTTQAYENERQRHITVGMNLSYTWKRRSSEDCNAEKIREKVAARKAVLIPYHADMGEYYDRVRRLILKIISESNSQSEGRKMAAIGYWYALLGVLTDFVLKRLENEKTEFLPSEYLYAEKATEYIAKNYTKKITVGDISDYLGISEGYLHRIFKNTKNCTVVEFINRYRIRIATELMETNPLSLKEAAYNVGIEDPCYMSRLFKKVMGVSYREYLNSKFKMRGM